MFRKTRIALGAAEMLAWITYVFYIGTVWLTHDGYGAMRVAVRYTRSLSALDSWELVFTVLIVFTWIGLSIDHGYTLVNKRGESDREVATIGITVFLVMGILAVIKGALLFLPLMVMPPFYGYLFQGLVLTSVTIQWLDRALPPGCR